MFSLVCSVPVPFMGDYVRLRRNKLWKETRSKADKHVVFADIVNKVNRSNLKVGESALFSNKSFFSFSQFVSILCVVTTNAMLIIDHKNMQIKYRIPVKEIFKMSLSPFFDDIAVFHVRESTNIYDVRQSRSNLHAPALHMPTMHMPGCLGRSSGRGSGSGSGRGDGKRDFLLHTPNAVELVTKLFLVIHNATGEAPGVDVATEVETDFGDDGGGEAVVNFRLNTTDMERPGERVAAAGSLHPHVKLAKKGDKISVFV